MVDNDFKPNIIESGPKVVCDSKDCQSSKKLIVEARPKVVCNSKDSQSAKELSGAQLDT